MERKFLLPGEYHATTQPMELVTVLGSCVAVCLKNIRNGSAAMTHCIHATPPLDLKSPDKGVYASLATEHIIQTLFAIDANKANYQAQIYGGSSRIKAFNGDTGVGDRNVEMCLNVLNRYGILVTNQQTGEDHGIRILFNTQTNHVAIEEAVLNSQAKPKAAASATPSASSAATSTASAPMAPAGGAPVGIGVKKVMVVDDSPIVRKALTTVINNTPGYTVVAAAEDAFQARDYLLQYDPDVMTLDIVMPKMDGISFLRRVTEYFPTPVVVCSTIAKANTKIEREAFEAGAAEVLDKETLELYKGQDTVKALLIPKLRSAMFKKAKVRK